MSLFHTVELHAREICRHGEKWCISRISCMPVNSERTLYYSIGGAVYSLKKNGRPNYRKAIDGTKVVLDIPADDHDKWADEWEARENTCRECMGTKKVFSSVSVTEGTKYRQCPRCHGTGKKP